MIQNEYNFIFNNLTEIKNYEEILYFLYEKISSLQKRNINDSNEINKAQKNNIFEILNYLNNKILNKEICNLFLYKNQDKNILKINLINNSEINNLIKKINIEEFLNFLFIKELNKEYHNLEKINDFHNLIEFEYSNFSFKIKIKEKSIYDFLLLLLNENILKNIYLDKRNREILIFYITDFNNINFLIKNVYIFFFLFSKNLDDFKNKILEFEKFLKNFILIYKINKDIFQNYKIDFEKNEQIYRYKKEIYFDIINKLEKEYLNENIKILNHQKYGINYLLENKKCILTDEMGLGKTFQAIASIIYINKINENIKNNINNIFPLKINIILTKTILKFNQKKEFFHFIKNDLLNNNYDIIIFNSSKEIKKYFSNLKEKIYSLYNNNLNNINDIFLYQENQNEKIIKSQIYITSYELSEKLYEEIINLEKELKDLIKDKLLKDSIKEIIKIKNITIDEAHYYKNEKSNRFKNLIKFINHYKDIDYIFLLSGTPVLNRYNELLNLFEIINVNNYFLNKRNIMTHFFYVKHDKFFNLKITLKKQYENKLKYIFIPFIYGRKKEEILNLPEKNIKHIQIDYNEFLNFINSSIEKKKEYNFLLEKIREYNLFENILNEDFIEKMNKIKFEDFYGNFIKYRIQLGNLKNIYIIEYIKNIIDEKISNLNHSNSDNKDIKLNDKFIIFSIFKENQYILYEKISNLINEYNKKYNLNQKVSNITGEMKENKRKEIIEKFNNDENEKIMILSFFAGKEGLNLTSANYVIFNELDYVPGNIKQAIDRVHRIGQKKNINVIFFLIEKTLDEIIFSILERKEKIIKEIV